LYLNTVAKGDSSSQTLKYCEDQIMEKLDNLENKKSLPEAFILKKLVEMGKNLIP
jgi:hypothetical protein